MKRHNKKFVLISILAYTFLITGCKNVQFGSYDAAKDSKEVIEDGQEVNGTQIDEEDGTKNNTVTNVDETKEDPTPTMIQPASNTELMVYTVNADAGIEPVTALIPEDNEITPQLVVDTVVDNMADNSLMIGVESVTTENDTVIVSFFADQPPLRDIGASYETAILDAIAQSLIENLDYSKVIYRVEGEAYISGHIELGLDEVYLLD